MADITQTQASMAANSAFNAVVDQRTAQNMAKGLLASVGVVQTALHIADGHGVNAGIQQSTEVGIV